MDFFKSIFADDPYPPDPESESNSLNDQDSAPDSPPKQSDSNPTGWSFGDLVKTIASRSESVIEVYRRDLQEFGTGLKNEIEVAQCSLGNVGHAIDELGSTVLKGTVQIINQGRDVILAASNESDSPPSESNSRSFSTQRGLNSRGYSRFDAQLRAIQGDISTYGEEPEDLEDYKKWKSGFNLEDKKGQIERLMEENGEIESIYKRVVGVSDGVDHEIFWCRYFYRVYKLQVAEDMRVKLVKRAISRDDEDEELSWDVDDDDDEKVDVKKAVNLESNGDFPANKEQVEKVEKDKEKNPVEELRVESDDAEKKGNADEKSSFGNVVTEKVNSEKDDGVSKEDSVSKSVEKVASEEQDGRKKSSNDNGLSSRPSMPGEEDPGWDEIEDLSSIDDMKGTHGGNSILNRADLRKRLSTAEEDEDLSWDIED
ncbi:hypothetical protein Gotri_012389 [Gossypium trilobum]|uniref:BSD domain-containing protein n=1 Tax=Gossypium trilobum TaxID=34281 RepID=A0A7J9DR20_9ROSI|nr:hypothetical protein [Gossypium trilobum]